MKLLIQLIFVLLLAGCITTPDYKSGGSKRVKATQFKYGTYCGKGHPFFKSEIGSQQRIDDLLSVWPPVDDVDFICYTHDICYEQAGHGNTYCDGIMIGMLLDSSKKLSKNNNQCEKLVSLLFTGMGFAPLTRTNNLWSSAVSLALSPFLTATMLMQKAIDVASLEEIKKPLKEGQCYINENSKLSNHILRSFDKKLEKIFENEIRRDNVIPLNEVLPFLERTDKKRMKKVSIPIP